MLRLKENADDYRYFPDPDLVPLVLSEAEIEAVRAGLPELADARCARYQRDFALSEYDARALTASRALADLFEGAVAQSSPGLAKPIANWLLRDVQRVLNDRELEIESARVTPRALADLVGAVETGQTTVQSARGLLPELVERGGDPIAWIRERGLEAVSDTDVIARAVDEVIREHAADVERVRAGEAKVLNFLIGQVMRRTGGKASPQAVRELLAARITP